MDYKAMYYRLFNRVSDAIEILQAAQQECENAFIEGGFSEALRLLENDEECSE
jgi:hypothetical protein